MQKAKLLILLVLLLAAAAEAWELWNRLPGRNDAHSHILTLLPRAADRDSSRLPGQQVSVQVLKESVSAQWADSVLQKRLGNAATRDSSALLPDSLFDTKNPCCNFSRDRRDVYWLRFAVRNRSQEQNFLLEVINPFINRIDCYWLYTQRDTVYSSGTDFDFSARPEPGFRNFLFPAAIAPNTTAWCYLRIRAESPLHLRLLLFEAEERHGHQQRSVDILMTVFYVFTALFLLLTAILISATHERFHWFYFGYVLLTALFIPAHLGLGFMYIWKHHGEFQHMVPMALNNLRLVCGIQFFRLYFDLPANAPRLNRLIGFTIGGFLLILLLQVAGWAFDLPVSRGVFVLFLGFLVLFSLAMLVWLLRELFFKRRPRFSWLLLVVALNFVGVGLTSLQHLGWATLELEGVGRIMAMFGIANTFFLSPFVMVAFFLEQVLVFNFAVRRYLRLLDKHQKNQLRLAKAKEEGLNALILGVENERRRIARDLHDGACVNLAAINMKVDALRETFASEPALARKVADIAGDIEMTYREVRDISHDLMSKTLEKTDLQTALEDLTGRIQQAQPGLELYFFANYPLNAVNDMAKIHLYRIVQELLSNVLKHARAETLNLQLLRDGKSLLLTVEDNGQGFDPELRDAGGIGMSNVRTRVEILHGKMHLDTAPGRGTFIGITIPDTALSN